MPDADGYPTADEVLAMFRVQYPYIKVYNQDVQGTESDPISHLLYNQFCMLYELARDEFEYDLLSRGGMKATFAQMRSALAHLIADYCEMSNPDWAYARESVTVGEGIATMSIERRDDTAPRAAYNKLLDVITRAGLRAAGPYNGSSNVTPFFTRDMPFGAPSINKTGISPDYMKRHEELD